MNWYIEVLKKYATFTGRARRTEYWMFVLINFAISLALGIVEGVAGAAMDSDVRILSSLYSLAVLLPSLAVGVRRLHDTDRSGWWMFIAFVPLLGILVLLYFFILEGTQGPNQYGPDPKGATAPQSGVAAPAGWLADPTGRHQLRYWDGNAWTDNVSDSGATSTDPL